MATTLEMSPDTYSRISPSPHPPFTQCCLSVCSVPSPVPGNGGKGPKAQTTGTEGALGKKVLGAGSRLDSDGFVEPNLYYFVY